MLTIFIVSWLVVNIGCFLIWANAHAEMGERVNVTFREKPVGPIAYYLTIIVFACFFWLCILIAALWGNLVIKSS